MTHDRVDLVNKGYPDLGTIADLGTNPDLGVKHPNMVLIRMLV